MLKQGIAARGIEFPKNVVQQQQRKRVPLIRDEVRLGEAQRQNDRSLLALAGKFRPESADGKRYFVPVRPDGSLAQSRVFLVAFGEGGGKIGAAAGLIGKRQRLARIAADGVMSR